MSDYNFIPDFPDWFWKLMLVIFFIGIFSILGGCIFLIVELVKHLRWV